MFGFGNWHHRAYEARTALYARSFSILEQLTAWLFVA